MRGNQKDEHDRCRKEFPNDAWSSLRMPSDVPLLIANSDGNAFDAALNILSQTNPVAYMHRQLAVESMDIYPVY